MIWFSASWSFTILPNSLGLPALPLRMTSVDGSNRLRSLPSLRVLPWKMLFHHLSVMHQALVGRPRYLAAADAAFYSAKNEAAAKAKGVKRVCIPNRSTKSPERKREQEKRWFRNGQKWRTGSEGRISVGKRRHGLRRCHYKGYVGMNRWEHRARYGGAGRPLSRHHTTINCVGPAGHTQRVLRCPVQLTTMPQTSILRRKVASELRPSRSSLATCSR
jgi:hypothetical protein